MTDDEDRHHSGSVCVTSELHQTSCQLVSVFTEPDDCKLH